MSFLDDLGGFVQQVVPVANSASNLINTIQGHQSPPVQVSPVPVASQGAVTVAPATPGAPTTRVTSGMSMGTIAVLAGAGVFGLVAVALIARR